MDGRNTFKYIQKKNKKDKKKVLKKIAPYLKITKWCKKGFECSIGKIYSLDGTYRFNQIADANNQVVLADGTFLSIYTIQSTDCSLVVGTSNVLKNVCGDITITFYPSKGNIYQGKDRFFFYLTRYGIYPMGTDADTHFTFDSWCNPENKHILNGYGCTAWVLQNENMDYLKCSKDLGWDKASKCK